MKLEKYNPVKWDFEAEHIVQVTFMFEDYVGHVGFVTGGNMCGARVLTSDFLYEVDQDDIDKWFPINDCEFAFFEEGDLFRAVLTNPEGHITEVDGDPGEFRDMIVAMEIVDYKRGGDNQ